MYFTKDRGINVKQIQIFAHRGSRKTHPENTMVAFIEAERVGADGIEFDVQLSSDGELIIIHDETLDRTTTLTGYVKDYTAEELKKADAGILFSEQFIGEQIPFLKEVFKWATENDLTMNVELKTDKFNYEGIEQKVIDLIREFHFEDRIILSSFNHHSLEIAKEIAPEIERALLFKELPKDIENILANKAESGFHPKRRTVTNKLIKYAQKHGYKVRPWTANKSKNILLLANLGVDAIFTDCPEKAVRLLR